MTDVLRIVLTTIEIMIVWFGIWLLIAMLSDHLRNQ